MAKKRSAKRRAADPRLDDLAAQIVKKLAVARGCYKGADKLIDELLAAGAKHGDTFAVGPKRYRLTDNFRGENKVFRTTAFVRWSLDHDGEAE